MALGAAQLRPPRSPILASLGVGHAIGSLPLSALVGQIACQARGVVIVMIRRGSIRP